MRWLLTSWGSRGDLHPFLALGQGLQKRGHQVTLVGHPDWQEETATAGVHFVSSNEPSREDLLREHPEIMSMRWGGLAALHALVHHGIAPGFDSMLAALRREAASHDVLVAHHFVLPAPLAAELSGLPWATISLAPGVVPTAYARPGTQFGAAGEGIWARQLNRLIWEAGKFSTRMVVDPVVNRLRKRHGLPRRSDAVFEAHSSRLNLQLYSRHFATPPPDWTPEKRQAGFCFYTPPGEEMLPLEIAPFLAAGEPPILFTLGSAAVLRPGSFYHAAVEALRTLSRRGILLIGPEENRPPALPPSILAVPYAPYEPLMARVLAVVHQCGIGTLSHTLKAGIPSVACPFAFDQPNNARRLQALGLAEVVLPRNRDAAHITDALRRLLAGDAPVRARRLGELLRAEDGVDLACKLLETEFAR